MSFITRITAAALLCAAFPPVALSQSSALTPAERAAAIEGIARQMEDGYVFPEIGRQMADDVRARATRGEYDRVAAGPELAQLLTSQLREVSRDLHIRVGYSPQLLPPQPEGPPLPTPEQMAQLKKNLAYHNYGLKKLEILPGNIGYIKFDLFAPPEFAGDAYAAAMAFVAETHGLIIDLRDNGGSMSPDAIPMIATYFFEQPTHLIDLKWNFEGTARQLWTWGHVPGRRYLDKPVYVLTSGRTFSGGEEFAYDLKHLGRAVIVGDTTGGGANGGGTRRASDHFEVFVPFGRVTSPHTQTNWEGVGVIPDIAVPASKALLTAQLEVLRTVKAGATEEPLRAALEQAEAQVLSQLARFKRVTFELKGYDSAREVRVAGTFNSWSPRTTHMVRRGNRWLAEVELEPGRHAYKFIVDGAWILDPANAETERDGEHVNSARTVY